MLAIWQEAGEQNGSDERSDDEAHLEQPRTLCSNTMSACPTGMPKGTMTNAKMRARSHVDTPVDMELRSDDDAASPHVEVTLAEELSVIILGVTGPTADRVRTSPVGGAREPSIERRTMAVHHAAHAFGMIPSGIHSAGRRDSSEVDLRGHGRIAVAYVEHGNRHPVTFSARYPGRSDSTHEMRRVGSDRDELGLGASLSVGRRPSSAQSAMAALAGFVTLSTSTQVAFHVDIDVGLFIPVSFSVDVGFGVSVDPSVTVSVNLSVTVSIGIRCSVTARVCSSVAGWAGVAAW